MKYLVLLLVLIAAPSLAQQSAVTSDGKSVLLKDNGTWEYTEEGAAMVAEEKKEYWTDISINVAKILGIVAALIILRFVIQAIGKGVTPKEDPSQQKKPKPTDPQ
jgi:hypothetical protein